MAYESGKRQVIKFLLLIIGLFSIVVFMLLSFLIIPYKDIETYLLMQLTVDGILIMLVIFCINYRVWRRLSGKIFYGLEIYDADGEIDNVLWEREAYFEVDIDKIEDQLEDRQKKILRENEAAITDLKRAVKIMTKKQQKREEKERKAKLKQLQKEKKEQEKKAKREAKRREEEAKMKQLESELEKPAEEKQDERREETESAE